MLVLIPPSEGKATGGKGRWKPGSGRFGRRLGAQRRDVAGELAQMMATVNDERARKFFGVKGEALAMARADGLALPAGPPAMAAAERYTGVVMGHVDRPGLGADAQGWFDEHVAFVSGLHVLVGAKDPTPPYRLKMGASLGELAKLSTWWRPVLDRAVNSTDLVVDLLTNEHRSAFTVSEYPGTWIRIDFTRADAKPAGHGGKATKGLFVRYLAQAAPIDADSVLRACQKSDWKVRIEGEDRCPLVTVEVVDA